MIDIHSHVLPGIDDGAADFNESLQMLELARETGTTAMATTPHADLRYNFDPERSACLRAMLQEQCPNGPRLYSGCEVHLTPDNIARILKTPSAFTLNAGDCLLLELPDLVAPPMVTPALQALADSGLRVIIAHPERNPYIQQNPSYMRKLVDEGCYLQITARSLSGGFGPAASAAATHMLKRRLAHFIASDTHGVTRRKPCLDGVYGAIAKAYGEPAARMLLTHNPEAAVNRAEIRPMPGTSGWLTSFFSRPSQNYGEQTYAHMREV
ncbi:MAG TPA: CpsB/CapC family capsule biosynthesis tyrosine phosphatase [Bryobacteraceae bacterium]|nr:CpsB/CapC family capsule biosynthesis tyrosine phosphatase [Bryobacteraceae bacterium]